ncbi:arginase family protein [Actinomadura sp. HBU206391]|uniref:arginase family protein n=1 Tax=Actinomadura sp. HBU206391 TaxID=2731692 RepID=UPI002905EAE6|nr:arginase family protein [Actinomadura sp. HBU206391]
MAIISVPYHLDEYLPDLNIPLPPGRDVTTVAVALPDGDTWTRLGRLYESVAEAVAQVVRKGQVPTVVSGDCTASLGTVAGLQQAEVDASVVWFDAHGDVQTLETTASGYLGGMPLRILVGYRPDLISERLGLRLVPENRVVLVDGRDLDPPEADYLATSEIRRCGVDEVSADVLPPGPLLLHMDLDVIDSAELAGLRYPAPAGPTTSSVLDAARRVFATGRVVAVDIGCTWHPGHDDADGLRSRLLSALAAEG